MSYIALYRKWRPLTFSDVVEQSNVVRTLKNSVFSDRIAHAYLFCGTRGTGKTTLAKIFARAINCLNPIDGNPCNECEICKGSLNDSLLDIVELDAASNNSVQDIRQLCEESAYLPAQAKRKVYIIDEVHMLSTAAFNALLKTLEEPPKTVVFILATTDPQKLPATILSRCQRFDFKRIGKEGIANRLKHIAESTGVALSDDAADLLALLADGALRDGISILDQCISVGGNNIDASTVRSIMGISEVDNLINSGHALVNGDVQLILESLNNARSSGLDMARFCTSLIEYFRCLLMMKISPSAANAEELYGEHVSTLAQQAEAFSTDKLIYVIKELANTEEHLNYSTQPYILIETALVRLCLCLADYNEPTAEKVDSLEKQISALKYEIEQLKKGAVLQPATSVPVINSTPTVNNSPAPATKADTVPAIDPEPVVAQSAQPAQSTQSTQPAQSTQTTVQQIAQPVEQSVETKVSQSSQSSTLRPGPFEEFSEILSFLSDNAPKSLFAFLNLAECAITNNGNVEIYMPSENMKNSVNTPENQHYVQEAFERLFKESPSVRFLTTKEKKTSGPVFKSKHVATTISQHAQQAPEQQASTQQSPAQQTASTAPENIPDGFVGSGNDEQYYGEEDAPFDIFPDEGSAPLNSNDLESNLMSMAEDMGIPFEME